MKQSFEDLKLLIQNDRRIWFGAGAVIVLLIVWGLLGQGSWVSPGRRVVARTTEQEVGQSMSDSNTYSELSVAFREELTRQEKELGAQKETMRRLESNIENFNQRTTGIFETLVEKVENLSADMQQIKEKQTSQPLPQLTTSGLSGGKSQAVQENTLEQIGFEKASVPPPPPPPKPIKYSVVSSGDSVKLKLLTGVNAPVDGTPYPVVFKLSGPISGPDGASLDLGEARLIAAATGSETDSRVLFRLTDLAIRHKDGRRSVIKVDGWVVGEDGIRGMRGKLIDKLGRLIAATAGYSFVAALGEQMDEQSDNIDASNSQNIEVRSEDINVAATSALTDASNRLGQILLDRYEKLVPVVEVLSGREVAAVFSQPAEIAVMDDDEEGIYRASLE